MSFDTERFIQEIQNRPCLWDTATTDYSDRNLKVRCWDEIVNVFKEKDELTLQEKKEFAESLQKRWKNIRGCYTRELNRQKSVQLGSGCGSRKSEYIYFKQLQFLLKVVAIREPEPAAATADLADFPLNPENNSLKDYPVERRKRLKTKEYTKDVKLNAALNKTKRKESSDINDQDEDILFLLSLVKTLKRVPANRKIATKIKMMSVLDEETCTVPTRSTRNFCSSPSPTRSINQRCPGRAGSKSPSNVDYSSESSTSSH